MIRTITFKRLHFDSLKNECRETVEDVGNSWKRSNSVELLKKLNRSQILGNSVFSSVSWKIRFWQIGNSLMLDWWRKHKFSTWFEKSNCNQSIKNTPNFQHVRNAHILPRFSKSIGKFLFNLINAKKKKKKEKKGKSGFCQLVENSDRLIKKVYFET